MHFGRVNFKQDRRKDGVVTAPVELIEKIELLVAFAPAHMPLLG